MTAKGYKPTCRKCYYFGWDFITGGYKAGSFCGLHGCEEIAEPDKFPPPPLARSRNNHGYNCDCGFFPRLVDRAVQLTLF